MVTPGLRLRLAVGALLLAAAGCAADTADPSFNDTDVMFLQMMVAHHQQGIEIVKLAQKRVTNPELKTLAAAIEVTQTAEVLTMSGWLASWGQPLTADPSDHAAHGGMPGTSRWEMEVLALGPAIDFERGLLNMLIAHQDDAEQIAQMAMAGINPDVKALAQSIEQSRKAQIEQMLAMLGEDPSQTIP